MRAIYILIAILVATICALVAGIVVVALGGSKLVAINSAGGTFVGIGAMGLSVALSAT